MVTTVTSYTEVRNRALIANGYDGVVRGEVGNTLPESTVSEGESHGERAKPTLVARVKPPTLAASRKATILATRKVTTGQAAAWECHGKPHG